MKRHLSEVASWMTAPALTIHPNATLFEAYTLMFENDVRRLPVVDHNGMLLGIITMSDIQQAAPISPDGDGDTTGRLLVSSQLVKQVMSPDPVTITSDETVQEAAERMLEYEISGLPVIEGEQVIGIITESDVFRLVVESWLEEKPGRLTTHRNSQRITA